MLRGGRLINVFSGAIEETDIVIAGENIVGFGSGYLRARCMTWRRVRGARPD
ncbi:hypothetical protein [Candidatus Amarolinea dominans]|uniref:hypothetical protein n=1 Tax=Candidatus Amarolinea dominans TaxID=3140696 RepID=UPI0031CC3D21